MLKHSLRWTLIQYLGCLGKWEFWPLYQREDYKEQRDVHSPGCLDRLKGGLLCEQLLWKADISAFLPLKGRLAIPPFSEGNWPLKRLGMKWINSLETLFGNVRRLLCVCAGNLWERQIIFPPSQALGSLSVVYIKDWSWLYIPNSGLPLITLCHIRDWRRRMRVTGKQKCDLWLCF